MSASKPEYAVIVRHRDIAWPMSEERQAEYLDDLARSDPTLAREVRKRLDSRKKLELRHGFDRLIAEEQFDIEREIGRGATSTVFQARHRFSNKTVAIKQINSAAASERFVVEARAAARLDHPAVARIQHCGIWQGRPYLQMEFVDGSTLDECREKYVGGHLGIAVLLCKIASGVGHAHFHNIIHRDLKPRNILITRDGNPKIIDFGCAKAKDIEFGLTVSGDIIGTPQYMAPEQATGQPNTGPETDVFAIGLILYELLTRQQAFKTVVPDLFHELLNKEPCRPRSIDSHIPIELEAICLKCLEKDPLNRYPDGNALAVDLQRYLSGEPVAACRFYRLRYAANKIKRKAQAPLALSMVLTGLIILLSPLGYAAAPTIQYWWRGFCDNCVHARAVLSSFRVSGQRPASEFLAQNVKEDRDRQIARERELFETYHRQFDERMAKIRTGESNHWIPPFGNFLGPQYVTLPDGSKKALPTGIGFLDLLAEKQFQRNSDGLPVPAIPGQSPDNLDASSDADELAN